MPAPILTNALIDRVLREQRQRLRPSSGWGYSSWPLRAEQALTTLTSGSWCQVGSMKRAWWRTRGRHASIGVTLPLCISPHCHPAESSRNHRSLELIAFIGAIRQKARSIAVVLSCCPSCLAALCLLLKRIRFYDMRHAAASLLIAERLPITAVLAMLGHALTSTTLNVHAHVLPGADRITADAMERLLGRFLIRWRRDWSSKQDGGG